MCPPANHFEALRTRKVRAAGNLGDGLLAGIDQIGILFAFVGKRPDAKQTVLAFEHDLHARRQVVGHQRGHADTKVDIHAVAQFAGGTQDDAITGRQVGHGNPFGIITDYELPVTNCSASDERKDSMDRRPTMEWQRLPFLKKNSVGTFVRFWLLSQ
jgi:hypothetical protein